MLPLNTLILLIVAAAWVILLALTFRAKRRSPRCFCAACGYPIAPAAASLCIECGRDTARPSARAGSARYPALRRAVFLGVVGLACLTLVVGYLDLWLFHALPPRATVAILPLIKRDGTRYSAAVVIVRKRDLSVPAYSALVAHLASELDPKAPADSAYDLYLLVRLWIVLPSDPGAVTRASASVVDDHRVKPAVSALPRRDLEAAVAALLNHPTISTSQGHIEALANIVLRRAAAADFDLGLVLDLLADTQSGGVWQALDFSRNRLLESVWKRHGPALTAYLDSGTPSQTTGLLRLLSSRSQSPNPQMCQRIAQLHATSPDLRLRAAADDVMFMHSITPVGDDQLDRNRGRSGTSMPLTAPVRPIREDE